MKKLTKPTKLKLDAETVRSLDTKHLTNVAGGDDYSARTICFCATSKHTICEM